MCLPFVGCSRCAAPTSQEGRAESSSSSSSEVVLLGSRLRRRGADVMLAPPGKSLLEKDQEGKDGYTHIVMIFPPSTSRGGGGERKALRETLTDGFPPPPPSIPVPHHIQSSPFPSHPAMLPLPLFFFFLSPPSTQPLLPRAPKMIIRNRRKRGWLGGADGRKRKNRKPLSPPPPRLEMEGGRGRAVCNRTTMNLPPPLSSISRIPYTHNQHKHTFADEEKRPRWRERSLHHPDRSKKRWRKEGLQLCKCWLAFRGPSLRQ